MGGTVWVAGAAPDTQLASYGLASRPQIAFASTLVVILSVISVLSRDTMWLEFSSSAVSKRGHSNVAII